MKNVFSILFCICLFSTFLSAQNSVSIGLRSGMNLSTSRSDNNDNRAYVNGLALAIPIEIGITSKFFIQPELQYIVKGYKEDFGTTEDYLSLYSKYIEIPILAKLKFGNDQVKFCLIAGPSIGYLTGITTETFITGLTSEPIKNKLDLSTEANKEALNRLEIGAAVGFGVEVSAGNGAFLLDIRHNMDFNSYFNEGVFSNGDDERTNTGYSATIGYRKKSKVEQ